MGYPTISTLAQIHSSRLRRHLAGLNSKARNCQTVTDDPIATWTLLLLVCLFCQSRNVCLQSPPTSTKPQTEIRSSMNWMGIGFWYLLVPLSIRQRSKTLPTWNFFPHNTSQHQQMEASYPQTTLIYRQLCWRFERIHTSQRDWKHEREVRSPLASSYCLSWWLWNRLVSNKGR